MEKERRLIKIYKSLMFCLAQITLCVISYYMDSLIEFCIIMLCFLISAKFYKYQYHCDSAFGCLILSIGVFLVAVKLTVPVNISYALSGMYGLGIAYYAQYAGETKFIRADYAYIEPRYNELLKYYDEHSNSNFDINNCSKEDLVSKCKELNIPLYKVDELYDLFSMSINDYCDKYNIQYQSANNKRLLYRKKFNK